MRSRDKYQICQEVVLEDLQGANNIHLNTLIIIINNSIRLILVTTMKPFFRAIDPKTMAIISIINFHRQAEDSDFMDTPL
jgi:hypothetical protein